MTLAVLTAYLSVAALMVHSGCSTVSSLVFPPRYERISHLTPALQEGQNQEGPHQGCVGVDGNTMSYEVEGLRIDVVHRSDSELNALFPEESAQGRHSVNPYTYGNHLDPALGYVPNRFTVFEVTVTNLDLAKVEFQPLACRLTTNRDGEVLESFGISSGTATNTFEAYYRTRRVPGGNEDYRYNMRMSLVRSHTYPSGEKILRGEQYGGFVAFPPLADAVHQVTLHMDDLILKFNAYDKPLESVDLAFGFQRQIRQQALREVETIEVGRAMTAARLRSASRVQGNLPGDLTREVTAIDGFARSRLELVRACFEDPFMAGRASAGRVAVRFTVYPNGEVGGVSIEESTVSSDEVEGCIGEQVASWRLAPSTGGVSPAPEPRQEGEREPGDRALASPAPAAPTPASATPVVATIYLELLDNREE